MSECKHNHGFPITHDKCDACGSELRLRWDCNGGVCMHVIPALEVAARSAV